MGKMTKNRYPQKKRWKICDILVEIAAKKICLMRPHVQKGENDGVKRIRIDGTAMQFLKQKKDHFRGSDAQKAAKPLLGL